MTELDEWNDYCYECTGYGDDYSWNEETQSFESNCPHCPFNELNNEEDD